MLESAPGGTAWHAVANEGDEVRDIAAVVGRRLGLPVQQVPEDTFGPFGPIFAIDQPASSAHTREALGLTPTHLGPLEALENVHPDRWPRRLEAEDHDHPGPPPGRRAGPARHGPTSR